MSLQLRYSMLSDLFCVVVGGGESVLGLRELA